MTGQEPFRDLGRDWNRLAEWSLQLFSFTKQQVYIFETLLGISIYIEKHLVIRIAETGVHPLFIVDDDSLSEDELAFGE